MSDGAGERMDAGLGDSILGSLAFTKEATAVCETSNPPSFSRAAMSRNETPSFRQRKMSPARASRRERHFLAAHFRAFSVGFIGSPTGTTMLLQKNAVLPRETVNQCFYKTSNLGFSHLCNSIRPRETGPLTGASAPLGDLCFQFFPPTLGGSFFCNSIGVNFSHRQKWAKRTSRRGASDNFSRVENCRFLWNRIGFFMLGRSGKRSRKLGVP